MIILAGTIILSLNNTGIISKSKDAVDASDLKEVQQIAALAWSEAYIDKMTDDTVNIRQRVEDALKKNKVDITKYIINITDEGVNVELKGTSTPSDLIPKITLNLTNITLVEDTVMPTQTIIATTENLTETQISAIEWTSSNTNVARVSGSGKTATVTMVGVGTATITAKYGTTTATCSFTGLAPKITLDQTSMTLVEGNKKTITATIENITGNLTWTSSNTNVATVSGNGNKATVTVVGDGTATITAKYGTASATCTVSGLAQKITLNETNINVTGYTGAGSKTYTLTATTENVTGDLTWASSDENVASINGTGNTRTITINGRGTAKITVSGGRTSSTCTISVVPTIMLQCWSNEEQSSDKVDVTNSTVEYKLGDIKRIYVLANNLTEDELDLIEWTSSNDNVIDPTNWYGDSIVISLALMDATAYPAVGSTAILTSSYGGVSASCTVKIVDEYSSQ